MAWAGWASVGAALVVVGVILGAALSSSSAPDAQQPGPTSGSVAPPRRRPVAPDTRVRHVGQSHRAGPALCMLNQSMGTASATVRSSRAAASPRNLRHGHADLE